MRNLITAQEVIELAFAENSNMMAESISDTAIRIAEIKYIRPAFGVMYPLLADKYADFTNDYVKPALAYFVKCEIVSSIAIDMSNSGVAVANPQYQSAATDKQRQRLYDSEMSKAKTLLDFALEYIATHSEEFPDFSGEAPKKHHRVGGILLGGGTSRSQSASIAGEAFKNEIERLSKQVSDKVDKVEGKGLSTNDYTDEDKAKVEDIGDNTIIVDYDLITELKGSEEGDDVTHPEIAELVEKIYNEQEKLILVRTMKDKYEGTNPTYYVPDTNYSRGEFGEIIDLYASYTGISDGNGRQRHDSIIISLESDGKIWAVKHEVSYILSEKSVIDKLTSNSSTLPISARQGRVLKQELDKKPNSDGYYPDMSVGMADNLVGRGDVQDAQINFRPSAGADNITDGAARIERIKGNSVVYNQLATKSNVAVAQDNSANESAQSYILNDCAEYLVKGRWYYIDVVKNNVSGVETIRYGNISSDDTNVLTLGKVVKCIANSFKPSISYTVGANTTSTGTITPIIRDLTQMFGAGNEPATYEEYLQRKSMNIADEFAYNEGEIIDMKVDSLISTSDNAYDYTKGYARVMGGHTYDCSYGTAFVEKVYFSTDKDNIVAEENAMTSENGKYTFPSDGYAVPYTTDGDKREYCVCLQHSYDKPHPAYQQEVKDLSFIGEAFPNGMRRTPNAMDDFGNIILNTDAFDEIRYNSTKKVWEKVTRIGVARGLKFLLGSVFYSNIPDIKPATAGVYYERRNGLFSNKYTAPNNVSLSTMEDKSIARWNGNTNVYIKDSAYTTAEEFNEANKDLVIYYELAEPIVVELDYPTAETNMDYLVWDFGTEEAIASVPSAPFRADINYEPNAVDDLRWAVSEIRSLKAQLAQMSASVTNLSE